ncbi:Gfo/Idh/MocA family oxidoreductase [Fulvivirgaceae bacterium BMA10]|uniref:Gfo/Idh/MocA family oxidoreductase n=1 Tax=Splendidivirga corallicola TaxID=3051826 RepID=A0ABT8KW73_9BACT|nr:Gfo/Idh/MocA family oxidoreductase [Fulvivirgaceae bacterium BMA10]
MKNDVTRRNFVKKTAAFGVATSVMSPNILLGKDDRKARLGFIGTGLRGRNHVGLALKRDDVEIKAICDIDPDAINKTKAMFKKAGKKEPAVYGKDELDFKNLLERDDIDGVIISTPWLWHTRMAVAAMRAGKYAGVEVSAANTIQECWDLVNTYEATGVPCMILENVCYRPDVMAVLNMVRKGMFGEMVHLECGYQHDLRHVKFNDGKTAYGKGVEFGEKGFSEARWRTAHSVNRNGDLYPTHGVGPVAQYTNINRGNRFVSLTSTASKSRGLHNYIVEHGGEDHPNAKVKFKLGDVITTVIKTANDESIIVSHDTNLPRPYSLGFRVQGTKGIWMDVNQSLHIEGTSPAHRWEPTKKYFEEYMHPLWKTHGHKATGAGHGGMDWFVIHAFVESIKRKAPTPQDAYDAAAWSAITPLSEKSIADGSDSVEFPDFTRGRWMTNKPIFALNDEY